MLINYFHIINEALQIQINELTTIDDIKYIWPKIFRKQLAYRWGAGEKKLNMSSPAKGRMQYLNNAEINKRAYEISKENHEFSDEQIKEKLEKEGYNTNFNASYIQEMIKKGDKIINKI